MSADTGAMPGGDGATLERGLFAVMQTDVANFSGNITQREEWVARRLHSDLTKFAQIVNSHEGKVVADRGDGIKALFSSPVRAFQAAIAMQEYVFQVNLDAGAKANPLKHRIGLDVGDVLIQDGKIDGAVVTIAARLETRCTPGKICFSDEFHQMTKSTVKVYRSFKGSESLKGVSRMVRVWMASISVDLSDEFDLPKKAVVDMTQLGRNGTVDPPRPKLEPWQVVLATLITLALLGVTALYASRAYQGLNEYTLSPAELASQKANHLDLPVPEPKAAAPAVSEKPSVGEGKKSFAPARVRKTAPAENGDPGDQPQAPEEISPEEKRTQEEALNEARKAAEEARKALTLSDDPPANSVSPTKDAPPQDAKPGSGKTDGETPNGGGTSGY